jgi:hypothetical protein
MTLRTKAPRRTFGKQGRAGQVFAALSIYTVQFDLKIVCCVICNGILLTDNGQFVGSVLSNARISAWPGKDQIFGHVS